MKEANLSAYVRGSCLNEGCSETMGFPTRCPKCDPGEPVVSEAQVLEDAQEGAKQERAAIVRFLRASWRRQRTPGVRTQTEVSVEHREDIVEALERGEHLK